MPSIMGIVGRPVIIPINISLENSFFVVTVQYCLIACFALLDETTF